MSRILGYFLIAVLAYLPVGAVGQSAAEPTYTIHTSTNLVVEDVVVTDAHDNPIHDLTASDFKILEDGHPQTIKVFREHEANSPANMPPLPKLPPGTFTNESAAPTNGPLNILLLDKLNTPRAAQATVINQVLKYLKNPPTDTRIAIFVLTTHLSLLQGFTSDQEVLRALLKSKKGLPVGNTLMADTSSGDASADAATGDESDVDAMTNTSTDAMGNSPDAAMTLATLQDFEAEQQSFQLMLRARYTLDAFNQLAHYLSSLPGRKNVIWFSGSFPISTEPDGNLADPFSSVASAEDEYRSTVNLLASGQVAVYPIDARGLMAEPIMSAASSNSGFVKDPHSFSRSQQAFFMNTTGEHGTMTQMAEATGGKAFVDTNDLKTAITKAITAGSNYYTIAYMPTDEDQNSDYRKIDVKLDRRGAELAYRRGYFTNAPNDTARHHDVQTAQPGIAPYSYIRSAMLHGAPDPEEIVFVANVRPSIAHTETALAPGNQGDPKIHGPYRRYTVTFVANPREFACPMGPDGNHHCVLEFLTFVYGADGALINTQTNGVNSSFSPARFASFQKSQLLNYHQQISVPEKGEYYLRLGMHDDTSGNAGALELPITAAAKMRTIPVQAHAARGGSGIVPK